MLIFYVERSNFTGRAGQTHRTAERDAALAEGRSEQGLFLASREEHRPIRKL